jgi:hypothetical protein
VHRSPSPNDHRCRVLPRAVRGHLVVADDANAPKDTSTVMSFNSACASILRLSLRAPPAKVMAQARALVASCHRHAMHPEPPARTCPVLGQSRRVDETYVEIRADGATTADAAGLPCPNTRIRETDRTIDGTYARRSTVVSRSSPLPLDGARTVEC